MTTRSQRFIQLPYEIPSAKLVTCDLKPELTRPMWGIATNFISTECSVRYLQLANKICNARCFSKHGNKPSDSVSRAISRPDERLLKGQIHFALPKRILIV